MPDRYVTRLRHQVRPRAGTVRLLPDKRARQRAESKPVDWQSARWGADVAEAFTEVEQEFRARASSWSA
jgi:hypothetical protein